MSFFGGNEYLPFNTIRPKQKWTPIVTISGGTGTVSTTNRAGRYTLVGPKLVFITAFVTWTFTSVGGNISISLPFKASNETAANGMITGYDPGDNKMVFGTILSGQKSMTIQHFDGTTYTAAGTFQLDMGGFYYIL